MRIAFCTTCKGRAQHIKQTLPKNLADNADYEDAVFIILDYGSQDDLIPYLKAEHQADTDAGRLVVYSRDNDGPFRMAHAKNIAHRLGILHGAEILVNLDADNYTGRSFARYVAGEFERIEDRGFLRGRMVKGFMPRGISGRIVVTSKAFLKAGGYDERYNDWGPDDWDFSARLRRLGYEPFDIPVQHLSGHNHPDRIRFRDYPHARLQFEQYAKAETTAITEGDSTVVNFGRFGCSTLSRNFDPTDTIELKPVATRVFGIGMHKTGTVSLHEALGRLGLDSAHWVGPWWARAIYEEVMVGSGRSKTLERSYALSDLPLALIFRQLDVAYPGSKFILTMRNETDWLMSVETHWSEANEWHGTWKRDCFTNRCHSLLYGRASFDRETMRARYWRHNFEVLEYFKDRPEDLLVLNIDSKLKWPPLCHFLGLPVPDVPYPHFNRSR
jgi:hypothetical protein